MRVGTANPYTLGMHVQHDLGGHGAIVSKDLSEHKDDKLHGGVVVIMQQDFIHLGLLSLGLRTLFNADPKLIIGLFIVFAHDTAKRIAEV